MVRVVTAGVWRRPNSMTLAWAFIHNRHCVMACPTFLLAEQALSNQRIDQTVYMWHWLCILQLATLTSLCHTIVKFRS